MGYPQTVLNTSSLPQFSRTQVDVGQTAFFEGREFRTNRKISIPSNSSIVWKFSSDVDFILFEQSFSMYGGIYEFYAWLDSNVTETSAFSIVVPIIGKNRSKEYRKYSGNRYESQVSILSGGVITVLDDGDYVDVAAVAAPNATAQLASVGGAINTERYLPSGTYYLEHRNTSNSTINLIYSLVWEERPNNAIAQPS